MSERRITVTAGLTVAIDRGRCVCSEFCARIAPRTFETDENGLVAFLQGPFDDEAALREAAASCPSSAISIIQA